MDWTLVLAFGTAVLALAGAFVQREKERVAAAKELKDAKERAALEAELKLNYKEMNKKSTVIIDLQEQSKKELKQKTDKILALQDELSRKNELLLGQQKESLNFLSGGDDLVRLVPSINAVPTMGNKIDLLLYNKSKYPQYDIEISVSDNFKYQQITKDSRKDAPLSREIFDRVMRETGFDFRIEKLSSEEQVIFYTTNIPADLQQGFFLVTVKSRNGKFTNKVAYTKDRAGWWILEDYETYYHNIGK